MGLPQTCEARPSSRATALLVDGKKNTAVASARFTVAGVERLSRRSLLSAISEGAGTRPRCSVRSDTRHGHCIRRLQDLAAHGLVVVFSVRIERWRCRNSRCEQQIFAHALSRIAVPHARRTDRVVELVRLLGHAEILRVAWGCGDTCVAVGLINPSSVECCPARVTGEHSAPLHLKYANAGH